MAGRNHPTVRRVASRTSRVVSPEEDVGVVRDGGAVDELLERDEQVAERHDREVGVVACSFAPRPAAPPAAVDEEGENQGDEEEARPVEVGGYRISNPVERVERQADA
jgi:hypothetical protein